MAKPDETEVIDVTPDEEKQTIVEAPKESSILNIAFTTMESGNFKIKSDCDMFSENYYREPANLFDGNEYDKFIDRCESRVRKSDVYSAYIAYLKNEIGLTRDAFNGDITQDNATLEMHHGPIFTLYDYVKIAIDYLFDNQLPVSTFTVAKFIMNEHTCNRIQVVMLTKNNHKLVHDNKLFVDFRQCHGSLKEFITLYHTYIERSPTLLRKIANYKRMLDNKLIFNTDVLHISQVVDWSLIEKPKVPVDIEPEVVHTSVEEILSHLPDSDKEIDELVNDDVYPWIDSEIFDESGEIIESEDDDFDDNDFFETDIAEYVSLQNYGYSAETL